MTDPIVRDPFRALGGPDDTTAPRTEFAQRLRARLERGADLPDGVDMSVTTQAPTQPESAPVEILDRPGALPYLTVADGAAALDWYQAHLGARLRDEPILMDDGHLGHAELEIGGGVIYLAGAFGDLGLAAPAPGAVSVSLMLAVADTDRALAAARSGGAVVQREPYEAHGTRTAVIVDPFGHRWMLTGPVNGAAAVVAVESARRGDVVYPSLCTPDIERAARFYGSVLGWEYDPETRQVTNLGHRLGLSTLGDLRSLFLVYAVEDLAAAREVIIAGGGADVTEPDGHPGSLDAVDDQGARFAVYVPDADEPRVEQHPAGHGELTYITVHTPDSRAFREFYSRVLGWEFTAGRIDDGWEVDDSRPQIGIGGGAEDYAAVAMWAVDDIEDAVVRVVEAGGSVVAQPRREPYATVAECVDDQGVFFYLGQY